VRRNFCKEIQCAHQGAAESCPFHADIEPLRGKLPSTTNSCSCSPISCPMIHSRTPVCVSERSSRKGRQTSEISRSQDIIVSYDMHRMPPGDHDVLNLATAAVQLWVKSVNAACHCSIRHGPSPRPSRSQVHRVSRRSFLAPAAGCRDFARGHEVANVFLEEFVVVVELVVLLLDCFDPTEDGQ